MGDRLFKLWKQPHLSTNDHASVFAHLEVEQLDYVHLQGNCLVGEPKLNIRETPSTVKVELSIAFAACLFDSLQIQTVTKKVLVPQEVEEPDNVTDSLFAMMNESEVTPEPQMIIKKGLEFKDGMNVLGICWSFLLFALMKHPSNKFQQLHSLTLKTEG